MEDTKNGILTNDTDIQSEQTSGEKKGCVETLSEKTSATEGVDRQQLELKEINITVSIRLE